MAEPQPSVETEPQATVPSASTTDAGTAAPSSSAEETSPGDTREALLEAVQQAVPDEPRSWQQGDAGAGDATPASARSGQAADQAPEAELTKEELSKAPPKTRASIERLLNQRRELRAEIDRLKTIEPSAQAASSVQRYLADNDIGREDFLMMLELGASLRKGDFQRFYAGIKPYVQLAEEYLGVSLPPDLQQRVREGHMTTQAAMAFSRERMDRAMTQNNLHRQQQAFGQYQHYNAQQQQQQQRAQLAESIRVGVNAWESKIEQSDPDYAQHKRAAVQNMMWSVVKERGSPQSTEQAIQIAQESLRRVNDLYGKWAPQRRPTMRVPSSTSRNPGVLPEPKSVADVVRLAHQTYSGAARL